MVGLHLIKHMDSVSDEAVCARFLDSPSVPLFCGESHVQHALPRDRSSMTRWRQRNRAARLELLLAETLGATNRPVPGGKVVLGARSRPGNPCDGHTLAAQIAQTERITGVTIERASVDPGDRGHDAQDRRSGETHQSRVFLSGQKRGVTPTIRREIRRRADIEPVIGQMKADGHLGRNVLAGAAGDAITLVLAAAGRILRLRPAWLARLLAFLLSLLASSATAPPLPSPRRAARSNQGLFRAASSRHRTLEPDRKAGAGLHHGQPPCAASLRRTHLRSRTRRRVVTHALRKRGRPHKAPADRRRHRPAHRAKADESDALHLLSPTKKGGTFRVPPVAIRRGSTHAHEAQREPVVGELHEIDIGLGGPNHLLLV
jgi:hypothetical protein